MTNKKTIKRVWVVVTSRGRLIGAYKDRSEAVYIRNYYMRSILLPATLTCEVKKTS